MIPQSTSLDKQFLYSLFGAPLRVDVGTTVDGHRVYDQINPVNPTLILTLIVTALLFSIYMWFYLSPLFHERSSYHSHSRQHRVARPRYNIRITDPEMNISTLQDEKKSLISWIHRSSLGRFIDITGRIHNKSVERPTDDRAKVKLAREPTSFGIHPLGLEDYQIFNLQGTTGTGTPPSLALPLHFGNEVEGSLMQSILTPPPPAYAARPEGSSQFDLRRHQSPPSPGSSFDPHHTLRLVPRRSATDIDSISISPSTYLRFPLLHLSPSRSLLPPSPPRRSSSSVIPTGA
ncbi:hypothetical protein F5887DRAFT_1005234 [Amanita rubescens]|nr:hypothetical protein F5887DRAFT_1005234 [Amanita rubescens]